MTISRRSLLKSLALGSGAAVLGPIVQQLEAQASGQGQRPRRVVFVLQSNGFQSYACIPGGVDAFRTNNAALRNIPLAEHELPEDIVALTPYKDRVTLIQGLHGVHVGPYHGGSFGALGGAYKGPGHTATAQTIDAALARHLPAPFPIVGLGLDATHASTRTVYVCSAWGPNQTIATQCRPEVAYRTLFGSVVGDEARQDFDARTNLLDFLREDVNQIERQLAGPEREKFAAHVNALEQMSGRQRELLARADQVRRHAPRLDARYSSLNECERLEAQFDLTLAALSAGLTNVVTICSCLCSPNGYFRGLGIDAHLHAIGHGGSTRPGGHATRIRAFHFRLIADLVRRLIAIPEGNGTMMDNTMIVYTSDFADAHHSNGRNWPFVLIGGLGRIRTGRYFEFPAYGQRGNRSINALYCTLLHAAGREVDHFNLDGGMRDLDRHGPLTELFL
jgi:hypothetical protein